MRIESDGLVFTELEDLLKFENDMNLSGSLKLSEPIVDLSDNVLLKEHADLKHSIIEKLATMKGQYKPRFKLELTESLAGAVRRRLKDEFLKAVETTDPFTRLLFDRTEHNVNNVIENAVTDKGLLLEMFRIEREDALYFSHLARLGALALGVAMHSRVRYRFLLRNSFMAGLASGLKWRDYIPEPESDSAARQHNLNLTVTEARRIGLAEDLVAAIQNHMLDPAHPPTPAVKAPESEESEVDDAMSSMLVAEILRVAKYVHESLTAVRDTANPARELVAMLAYNAEKGFFHKAVINPIVAISKEYAQFAQRMIAIAAIENKCLKKTYAWIYPKPQATQILCRNKEWGCPYILAGWDLNIVSPQSAYGYIGDALNPGTYPKCKLQEELHDLNSGK